MLWKDMQRSPAFDGIVAGIGEQMLTMADKTRLGVLETARTNTLFLDGAPMHHLLAKSDFDLKALTTHPRGRSISRCPAALYTWKPISAGCGSW